MLHSIIQTLMTVWFQRLLHLRLSVALKTCRTRSMRIEEFSSDEVLQSCCSGGTLPTDQYTVVLSNSHWSLSSPDWTFLSWQQQMFIFKRSVNQRKVLGQTRKWTISAAVSGQKLHSSWGTEVQPGPGQSPSLLASGAGTKTLSLQLRQSQKHHRSLVHTELWDIYMLLKTGESEQNVK